MGMVRRRTRRRTMMVAGGLAYERGRNEQADQDQGYERAGRSAARPSAAGPGSPAEDATSEIERLASLHDSGALSDDEFAAAKAKILGI